MASEGSFSREPGSVETEPGFLARNRAGIIAGALAVIAVGVLALFLRHSATQPPVKQIETITIVPVQPPKPPPPPQPVQPAKMIAQPKMTTPETKPPVANQPHKAAPPKPAAAAPAVVPLGTSLKANGQSNDFNLAGTPGGNGLLGGGGGGGGGSRWGWYQSVISGQLNNALHANRTTTDASFRVTARIWVDASGLITRASVSPSGNASVDRAIQNQVLAGMRFSQPPPADMPMPIVLSLTGQQPLQ